MDLNKLALGAGATILTTGLIGGAAFAALAPVSPATSPTIAAEPAQGGVSSDEARKPGAGLQGILEKLVKAGTITQAQQDAILAAAKEAEGAKARPEHSAAKGVLGDLLKTATTYLALDHKALATQLHAGKSLGEIAGATAGKSRDGLVKALTDAATAKIDAAVTGKTITADQAAKLKSGLAAHIAKLVDHKAAPRPEHPKKP
ncbi:MAG TPA: hypothetical protein VM070_07875 [Candidatus Saccharimonadales bacterium]|nr:hypothetical protein [Candidatus Saccharimonadales bacterium]